MGLTMDIYGLKDYRSVIRHWLENEAGRGGQRRLSEAGGCQPSYLSQVLSGAAEITLDQAYGMGFAMDLDPDSSEFFLLLVQRDRAASKLFREHLSRRIDAVIKKKSQLSERFNPGRILSGDEQARYYASWHYSAIHTLTAVPEFQTIKALEKRLRLSAEVIERAVHDLENMAIVRRDGVRVIALARDVHASSSSALNFGYHAIWRAVANQRMQEMPVGRNTHYTALYGLSRSDVQKLKSMMLEFIQKTREVVGPSAEETVAVMACDLFEL